jgi:hypothetical protein
MRKRIISLAADQESMLPGDLVLWEPTARAWQLWGRIFSLGIRVSGRSRYCHVDMLARNDDRPSGWELLGMVETGGRATPLTDEVLRYPGKGAWYLTNPDSRWTATEFSRENAVRRMRALLPNAYGWQAVGRMSRCHLLFIRLFAQPDFDDESPRRGRPVCSTAVAEAIHAGGVDPVLELADSDTEPGDLTKSLFFRYQGHLVP